MKKSIDKRISESLKQAEQIKKDLIEKAKKDKERHLNEIDRTKELAQRDKERFTK